MVLLLSGSYSANQKQRKIMNRFANISASASGTFGKFYQKFVKFLTHNQIFNFGKIPMLKVMKTIRCRARNLSWMGGCYGGLEAEPQALENLHFFGKNNLILGLF